MSGLIDSFLTCEPRNEVVYGLTFADYQAADGLNASALKSMATSPLQFYHDWYKPRKDTPSMRLGRAIHCALLEPAELEKRYRLWTGGDKRKCPKEWKAFKAECALAGAEILDEDGPISLTAIQAAAERWRQHKPTMAALDGSRPEVSLFWHDGVIQWKARVDLLREDLLGDVKTSVDIRPYPFRSSCEKYEYPMQLGIYREGVSVLLKRKLPVQLLCIQNSAPYDCRVYAMPEDDLDWGWVRAKDLAAKVVECVKANDWPGQGADEVEMLPPPSAWQREDDEDTFTEGDYE